MNIDRTHKENILYVEDKGIMLCANSSNLSNISLEDMYNFVKEDLALAQYNQINEEEEEIEFDEDGFPISFPNNSEPVKELGLLGQDIIASENPIIAFNGVLISWLILDKKSDFALFAFSAWMLAFSNCFIICISGFSIKK